MKNQMKKFLFIFPPLWSNEEPHMAMPSLAGQLKDYPNFKVNVIDLNAEFELDLLTQEAFNYYLKQLEKHLKDLEQNKTSFIDNFDTEENTILNQKYNTLKNIDFNNLRENIKFKQNLTKYFNEENFYFDLSKNRKLKMFSDVIKSIIYSTYFPLPYIHQDQNGNKVQIKSEEKLQKFLNDNTQNIFLDYYKAKIDFKEFKTYDYIGLSISDSQQLLAGLTLAMLLKKNTNAHITIGGNLITKIADELAQIADFFENIADSLSIEDGEASIVEFAKYINNEIPIGKVPNLIYKQENTIHKTKKLPATNLSKIKIPDYSDINFTKYKTPIKTLPLQITRGCYWGKCAFCDMQQGYNVKDTNTLIKELKHYKEKYNITHFNLVDETVSPAVLEKISKALLKNGIKIKFFIRARLEKGFTQKLLELAYKAGLRSIAWGLESANKRISKLMKKGINIDYATKIFEAADKAGIWNHVYSFYNFPTETFEEAKETLNFIYKNKNIIHSFGFGKFTLTKNSKIYIAPEKFKIEKVEKPEFLSLKANYEIKNKISEAEEQQLLEHAELIRKEFLGSKLGNSYPHITTFMFKYELEELKAMFSPNA